ncbi:hypothetical protein C2845_PM15G04930 [Panicum miliaceum]|uniref:Uncharacterized protein n=1 Tax=Panicum miliaceum TaxID=4540 RepID=A0A3L6Q8L5_PANMI|nr:hypothetical protein C2845_PM15G04930 [Panicum miliaceum]
MSKNAEISDSNIIEVTEADLKDDQRKELAKHLEDYKKMYLQSFSRTRSGEAVKKTPILAPRHITIAKNSGKMSEMIQQSVYQAFIDQSSVMTNTVYNAVVSSLASGAVQGYQGPAYAPPTTLPARSLPYTSQSAPQPILAQREGYNSPLPPASPRYSGAPCLPSQTPLQPVQIASVQSLSTSSVPWGTSALMYFPEPTNGYGSYSIQMPHQSAARPTVPQYQPISSEIGTGASTVEAFRGTVPTMTYGGGRTHFAINYRPLSKVRRFITQSCQLFSTCLHREQLFISSRWTGQQE